MTIFSCDFPQNIVDTLAWCEHIVEAFKGILSIFFVHESAEILAFDFLPGVAENPAQSVVEEKKITLNGGFEKSVGHILDKDAIAVPGYIAGIQMAGIVQTVGVNRWLLVQILTFKIKK